MHHYITNLESRKYGILSNNYNFCVIEFCELSERLAFTNSSPADAVIDANTGGITRPALVKALFN